MGLGEYSRPGKHCHQFPDAFAHLASYVPATFLSRRVLWADELPSPDKEHLHIVFGEKDLLVDVQGSVSYLRNEGIPDECMSIMETYQHGQALMHHGEGMRIALGYAGLRT